MKALVLIFAFFGAMSASAEVGRGLSLDQLSCVSTELERETPEALNCREILGDLNAFAEEESAAVLESLQTAAICSSNSQCLFNEACVGGRCVRRSPIGACRSDLDCFASDRCFLGRCQRRTSPLPGRCVTNLDCGFNERCRAGRCVRP